MNKKSQHVISNHKEGWAVRQSGAEKASKVFGTEREAVRYARSIAKKEKTDLYVHGRNGAIKEKDSYGDHPYPAKKHK